MPTTCSRSPTGREQDRRAVTLTPYARISRLGTPHVEGYYILHEGLIGVLGEKLQEINYADALKEGGAKFDRPAAGSASPTSTGRRRSFPPRTATYNASFKGRPAAPAAAISIRPTTCCRPLTAGPGPDQQVDGHLFAGAKQVKLIEAYEEKLKIRSST